MGRGEKERARKKKIIDGGRWATNYIQNDHKHNRYHASKLKLPDEGKEGEWKSKEKSKRIRRKEGKGRKKKKKKRKQIITTHQRPVAGGQQWAVDSERQSRMAIHDQHDQRYASMFHLLEQESSFLFVCFCENDERKRNQSET